MKLNELGFGSDLSIEMLDFVLMAMIRYGWLKEEIIQYVNDNLDLKLEEKAS